MSRTRFLPRSFFRICGVLAVLICVIAYLIVPVQQASAVMPFAQLRDDAVDADSTSVACSAGGSQEVYRLYNPSTSEHLFTTDVDEYRSLSQYGWKQEGVAWVSPDAQSSSVGVYRLYNPRLGDHHYTKDKDEAKKLIEKYGWRYDNGGKPLFYSDDECQRIAVYRQYNGGLKVGQHHYTADENEAKALITKHGWKKEGIGWYAVKWR